MIIVYGENLGIDREAVLDIVRINRDHPDDRLRRMAVVALGATQDAWAVDFLKRSVRFESSPLVRHTIQAVVSRHTSAGPAKVGS